MLGQDVPGGDTPYSRRFRETEVYHAVQMVTDWFRRAWPSLFAGNSTDVAATANGRGSTGLPTPGQDGGGVDAVAGRFSADDTPPRHFGSGDGGPKSAARLAALGPCA